MRRSLLREGYDVIEAEDGLQALELATVHAPDVLVLDWLMPGMQGPDVCAQIRSQPGCGRAAVLLLTSRAHEDDIEVAFERGADDYLTKPFDVRELTTLVGRLAQLSSSRQAAPPDEPPSASPPIETDAERRARGDALFARLHRELAEIAEIARQLETPDTPSGAGPAT